MNTFLHLSLRCIAITTEITLGYPFVTNHNVMYRLQKTLVKSNTKNNEMEWNIIGKFWSIFFTFGIVSDNPGIGKMEVFIALKMLDLTRLYCSYLSKLAVTLSSNRVTRT